MCECAKGLNASDWLRRQAGSSKQELAIALLVRVVAVGGVGGCGSTSASGVGVAGARRLLGLASKVLAGNNGGWNREGRAGGGGGEMRE